MSYECSLETLKNQAKGLWSELITCRNNSTIIQIDPKTLSTKPSRKAKQLWKNTKQEQKEKLEKALLNAEKKVYSKDIERVKRQYPTPQSIQGFLESKNIKLTADSLFGTKKKDILAWLDSTYSGYPDLAYKLVLLIEKGHIKMPPDDENISLTRINAVYQKAFERGCENPTQNRSLFMLKTVYDGLLNHYYAREK